ncbi:uncharacterized protein LAESUDRAFT_741666 [Laetiporus sulphureus 93-53]|uniref:Rho-GAP domain-containing protein n=1 Tax=Laetiporus sulphureus 93-53 TaxID=1314785 RepID=A0A165GAJ3_9APHY|nr:uncharacterized protein LAESUDRAFT_741666 [Laetiporus sulphureus 93-53]KZT10072.1 hypothetical protein LAESUDRAFT_741666 [Laetiporus sulphureus 93-53]
MAVLSLPLTFQNSFWTQDYRTGLEVLYTHLDHGILENEEIIAFIRARAIAEGALAAGLTAGAATGKAFANDEGASLHVAFRGLKEESKAQGKVHEVVAMELQNMVAGPFEKWANGYKERLRGSKHHILENWMVAYEMALADVKKLKSDYINKTRRADEAEDDARFAPIPQAPGDKYTISPSLQPRDKRAMPTRTPTMSERISQRFKELRLGAAGFSHPEEAKPEVQFDAEAQGAPKLDKGKGREIEEVESPAHMASPPPMSPPLPPARLDTDALLPPPAPLIVLAGVSFTPGLVSDMMKRAKKEMPLRSIRFPLIGEYPNCFSGEDFATWLRENVKEFEGSLDRAEEAAKELIEKQNLARRIGEFGNEFEDTNEAFYQFRTRAFELDEPVHVEQVISPLQKELGPLAENVAKRATNLASLVSKALNANGTNEPAHIRARREADIADREYRVAVRKLDRQRLALEERIEDTLKTLQKWEVDRLRAAKTVLKQYYDVLAEFSKSYVPSLERSSTLIDSYHPEADIKVFIELHRTGSFRPEPQVYDPVTHDESDVVFGIDLRRWADSGLWPANVPEDQKDDIPPALTAMLHALEQAYTRLPNDLERRKAWIYDVPLPAVHHLRESMNAIPPEQPLPEDMLAKYDAPVLASAIKLWALELDPPIAMYEGWDEFRKLYPIMGSGTKPEETSEEQHIQDVQGALQHLPKVHLMVLDTIVKHLKELIASTPEAESEESNEIYTTKLALTMGRAILRPKQENEFSIQDRHPTLLFIELLDKYDAILPPTIERKRRESQRKMPARRRTRPVDMRMSQTEHDASIADISLPLSTREHAPTHPAFKEPPPETDNLPRPIFREPPPEPPSPTSARPSFASPPPEPESPELPVPPFKEQSAERDESERPASPRVSIYDSRSPSPPKTSGTSPTPAFGARIARAPRVGGGGSVSSMVNNLNRRSVQGPRSGSPGSIGSAGGLSRAGSRTHAPHSGKRVGVNRSADLSKEDDDE